MDHVGEQWLDSAGSQVAHAVRLDLGPRLIEPTIGPGRARTAEPLVDEWLRSTEMLADFRKAPDFWNVAFQFALEEYRRERVTVQARSENMVDGRN